MAKKIIIGVVGVFVLFTGLSVVGFHLYSTPNTSETEQEIVEIEINEESETIGSIEETVVETIEEDEDDSLTVEEPNVESDESLTVEEPLEDTEIDEGNFSFVEDETADETEDNELSGESYFKDVPMPKLEQETFNGKVITPLNYLSPHTEMIAALDEISIDWENISLLRGEYVYFIQDILEVGEEVAFEEDVGGNNRITVKVKDESINSLPDTTISKLKQGYENSELYSSDVDYELRLIFKDGTETKH